MPAVIFTDQARSDLFGLIARIGRLSRPAATRLAKAVHDRCRLLGSNPGMGQPRHDLRPGVRSVVVENKYLILFESRDDAVYILRIVDGRRNLTSSIVNGS